MPLVSSPTGVIGDPRLDPKVINGWKSEEVIAGDAPVTWIEKTESQLRKYEVWNQDGSSACVAFSKAKQIAIEIFLLTGVWIALSPASIYQLRANAPGLGMQIGDANDIVRHRGATLDALMKSQNLSETQINAVKRTKVADRLALALSEAVVSYLYVPNNIEKIAQITERGKAVSLLVFAEVDEYGSTPKILHPNLTYDQATIRHEIVAVDHRLVNGVKTLRIEDSAHFAGFAVRDFTEEFISKRVILADFLAAFDFEGGGMAKPSYDGSIISLQKCLRFEGFFPLDVDYTEIFGPVTRAGVIKFQLKYGITPPLGNVGPITKAKLIELYP